ncbi:FAD-binding oxidoreductase [Marinobacter salicampi]|uniref:FAD-binding oxidoreductase n=1 Tax=Marinobacter salicampi TaxID=435907 RepID=UPI00140AE29F|nr:FAD-binding oxidoreductase [Marinobacter salicampi]
MVSSRDVERARSGGREVLDDLNSISRAREGARDPALGSLLGDIGRRRARQSARLQAWLSRHEEALPEAGKGIPGGHDSARAGAVSDERPATAEKGVTVTECREVAPGLIIFRVPRPLDFSFRPGQSVKVGVEGVKRSFSIVSAPHEPTLEFFVELVPGGQMSERLRTLAPGHTIILGNPKGSFLLDSRYREHLMVATVTGINPFVSMIRDALHQGRGDHRFHLLHGASYQNEFGYREELQGIAASHPEILDYVPTVSRPEEPANSGWTASQGRVDAIIEDYVARKGLDASSTMLYICGHSGMIGSVEQQFRPRGFQIETEDYD